MKTREKLLFTKDYMSNLIDITFKILKYKIFINKRLLCSNHITFRVDNLLYYKKVLNYK